MKSSAWVNSKEICIFSFVTDYLILLKYIYIYIHIHDYNAQTRLKLSCLRLFVKLPCSRCDVYGRLLDEWTKGSCLWNVCHAPLINTGLLVCKLTMFAWGYLDHKLTKLDVMANEENEENWNLKLRQDTEQEFFTELALHEAERWIQVSHRESCKCDVVE